MEPETMRYLVLAALLLATPAPAQNLPGFEGQWQGEGRLVLGDEPEQRFRCQLRLRPQRSGQSFLVGRCATAQAQQSFAWMLTEAADGTLTAEDTQPTEDLALPRRMQGSATPDRLWLGEAGGRSEGQSEGALMELRREGETLRFTLAGQDSRGPARGEALLQRRD